MHHLFVMSVDALFTENLADVRKMPGFAQVLKNAAIFEHVDCVYPTLTYVCHASIMSGCWPDRHGIPHNQILDPAIEDRDWYWDYSCLKVPAPATCAPPRPRASRRPHDRVGRLARHRGVAGHRRERSRGLGARRARLARSGAPRAEPRRHL